MPNTLFDQYRPEEYLQLLFKRFIELAHPRQLFPSPTLAKALASNDGDIGQVTVIAAGKAAASMAQAAEQQLKALGITHRGLAITRHGHSHDIHLENIKLIEASHPMPDSLSLSAGKQAMELASGLNENDLLLVLLSGGASALLCQPAIGIDLAGKQTMTRELLHCGATISQINCVRRRLSRIKGGGLLAEAQPAKVVTLAISDVPGNNPASIGSGPTIPLSNKEEDPIAILNRFNISIPQAFKQALKTSQQSLKIPDFNHHDFHLLATPESTFSQLITLIEGADIDINFLGANLQGDAQELGYRQGRQALELTKVTRDKPLLILSGGETSVNLTNMGKQRGRGGRNGEYLLGVLRALSNSDAGEKPEKVYALACDSDGIDGTEDNAGAWAASALLSSKWQHCAMTLDTAQQENRSYDFFAERGSLIKTGPTLTNVNDFRAILVLP